MNPMLRPVQPSDRETLFKWRNSSYIVERSPSQKEVTIEEHNTWFGFLIASADIFAFMIEKDGEPVGHLRFDPRGNQYIITIYIMPCWSGNRYGIQAIRQGCEFIQAKGSTQSIIAFVRHDNSIAVKTFLKAGFFRSSHSAPADHLALEYTCIEEEKDAVNQYQNLFKEYGLSHKALNWGSAHGQQLRFKVLAEIGALDGKRILDVGCGLGDFAGWLNRHNISVAYTGLDLTKDFIEQARVIYPSCEFVHGSIIDSTLFKDCVFDYVFASGIFYNYPLGRTDWMLKAIKRMWSLCKDGISFNSLSTWADSHDSGEFYADPVETISICKELTHSIVFRHDYHPRDFTVYLYRRD